jgi:hypothetical protein
MNTSTVPKSALLGKRLITTFVVAEGILLAGNLLVRVSQRQELLPAWGNIALALATAIPMIWFAFHFMRMLRNDVDEMMQRVVLEGLAVALVTFLPLAGLYVNLRTSGWLTTELDPPELLLIPSIFAVIGILISWSRFK